MLSNLYIKNYKILDEVDLVLSNLNLFSGKNSVGKSSLIQVLLLLRQSFEQNTLLKEGLLLQGAYINIGWGKDALSYDRIDEDIFKFILNWDDSTELNLSYNYNPSSDLQGLKRHKQSANLHLNSRSLFNTNFTYLAAERVAPDKTHLVSDYYINTLKSIGIKGEYTTHYLAQNQDKPLENHLLLHPNNSDNFFLTQVNEWMSEICIGIKISAKILPEIGHAVLAYEFATKDGYTEKFKPQNVGFGLTYVLPVVTAILASKPNDILLIENPESHLHPAGQAAMGRLISLAAQSGVQLFIETHSDHLLNGIRVAVHKKELSTENVAIFYFSKDESLEKHRIDIITPYLDSEGRLDEWPKGFFDEWEKKLDELLDNETPDYKS
jgi:predicted ATPase